MIVINELSVTVPGNVVKNNDGDGNSTLRFTQGQAQALYDSLGPVLDFFSLQATGTPERKQRGAAAVRRALHGVGECSDSAGDGETGAPDDKKKAPVTSEAGIQHDGPRGEVK